VYWLFYGGIYAINDLADYKEDVNDPIKKDRVIASGKVSTQEALILALALVSIGLVTTFFLNKTVFVIFLMLLAINLTYNFVMKKVAPYLDTLFLNTTGLFKIAIGMVLFNPVSIIFNYVPLFVMYYLCNVGVSQEKKYKELKKGQKRKFWFGKHRGIDINRFQILITIPQVLVLLQASGVVRIIDTILFCAYILSVAFLQNDRKLRAITNDFAEIVSQGAIPEEAK
jgi:4-hydroxybenzoate polyprenyltransferase